MNDNAKSSIESADGNCPVGISIRQLRAVNERELHELAEVLLDCVEGGASVGFMSPFTLKRSLAFWTRIANDVSRGARLLLVAEDAIGICGTVQLILDLPENQPHRADLVKMLVHRRVRKKGVGSALMRAIEKSALEAGRFLLVLDAVTDGDAARLYERLGWIRAGDIPQYALFPDGAYCSTTYFYRNLSKDRR